MNKLVLREALKNGFSLQGNLIVHNAVKVDLNKFLIEINRLRFTRTIEDSINLCKENLFHLPSQKIMDNKNE